MKEVYVSDAALRDAAMEGMDAFVKVFTDAITDAAGGQLTAESMSALNSDQITLVAWQMMHDEVMDGGFVQLIHNGLGGFIFLNPFAKALREWGLQDLSKLVYGVRPLYERHHEAIERDCTDEEFMALFEQFPEFDDYDDAFVENEEQWMEQIAQYVDDHLERFAKVN